MLNFNNIYLQLTVEENPAAAVLDGFREQYIMGQTAREEVELENVFDEEGMFTLSIKQIYTFVIKSQPTGRTNLSFPANCIRENYLFRSNIDSSSPSSLFLLPSYGQVESVFDKMLGKQAFKNLLIQIPGVKKIPFIMKSLESPTKEAEIREGIFII